jgi:hypothetical protein
MNLNVVAKLIFEFYGIIYIIVNFFIISQVTTEGLACFEGSRNPLCRQTANENFFVYNKLNAWRSLYWLPKKILTTH